MVDFAKRVGKAVTAKPLEPSKIYDALDRASDKGPLRPAQAKILEDWHKSHRVARDLIVKLQTGQGKTLVGLLMCQSKLNEGKGPAVYLCADKFLVQQTIKQAREFGFVNIATEPDAEDFQSGHSILITTVDRMFNGLSAFHLRSQSMSVGTVLMDDAHACADSIQAAFSIKLPRKHDVYQAMLSLFEEDLEFQGPGTLADIKNGNYDAVLPVPYWSWSERANDVIRFLAKKTEENAIKFPWALIKDDIPSCQCVISGGGLEIAPRLPMLDVFGSYWKASHRIFMSATITNDAFLIKGLNIDPKAIQSPLTYSDEKWYGEKMVLVPSLLDEALSRRVMVNHLAPDRARRGGGYVALTPSFKLQSNWSEMGAEAVDKSSIDAGVKRLYDGNFTKPLVLANKYDGIDLPDNTCRVLIIDSKPFADSLIDRYQDQCRSGSEVTQLKTARTIEQGMGRAVRGQRDYCVVILIGPSLLRAMRTGHSKMHFSSMTHKQIDIGNAIADLAKEEIAEGVSPILALDRLIRQCLDRDEGWKDFYTQEMDTLDVVPTSPSLLEVFQAEMEAETLHLQGQTEPAIKRIQSLIETTFPAPNIDDRAWYLQEIARFKHAASLTEANQLQVKAHRLHRLLLRPRSGMIVEPLIVTEQRISNIKQWLESFETNEALMLMASDISTSLTFGTKADDFESGLNRLGLALGFSCQRPDKEWREGPDNLWGIRAGQYILFECKNEVEQTREAIYKSETGQMNNSCAWFTSQYPGALAKKVLIISTKQLGNGAGFNENVVIMRKSNLRKLTKAFVAFCKEFKQLDLKNLTTAHIQEALEAHKLGIDNLLHDYYEEPLSS